MIIALAGLSFGNTQSTITKKIKFLVTAHREIDIY
jgi:hypothetical protein